jgi:type I restriction enzyme S subunit
MIYKLEDCLDAIIDYRGKTPEKTTSGIPLITAKVIKNGRIEKPTEFIAIENYDSWMRRGLPNCGDIVLTVEAPLGEVAQLGCEIIALAQRVVTLRGKKNLLNSTYLLYWLQSEPAQEQLKARATGTTVIGIKQSELRKVEIPIPPLAYQVEIAEMLSTLDDRITLLRETNTTLEAIAQALFKSWFIDFDPVHAKMQGQSPEGMDEATAALFPDSFEETKSGPVPKGWADMTIGDVINTVGGATPDTKNPNFWEPPEHYWTTPKDLSGITSPILLRTERKLSTAGINKIGSGLLPIGSLLMSSRAPIGYLALTQTPMAINQGYIAFPPGGTLSPMYMYFWCKVNMDKIKARSNGSTFMEISKKALRPIPILVPQKTVRDAFEIIVSSLFMRLIENEKQSKTIEKLRENLLPRLISGQLKVPEVN